VGRRVVGGTARLAPQVVEVGHGEHGVGGHPRAQRVGGPHVVLAQIPSPVEVAGVALVVAGIAVHREPSEPTEATEVRHTGPDPALATVD